MLELFADASFDNERGILAAGYVAYELSNNERTLIDTGNRALNTNADSRDIDWCSTRGEYWGVIVGLRAVLDRADQPIIVHTDCNHVRNELAGDVDSFEGYFTHAARSFLHRFDDYYVRTISRDSNEISHDQARLGLRIGREIMDNT